MWAQWRTVAMKAGELRATTGCMAMVCRPMTLLQNCRLSVEAAQGRSPPTSAVCCTHGSSWSCASHLDIDQAGLGCCSTSQPLSQRSCASAPVTLCAAGASAAPAPLLASSGSRSCMQATQYGFCWLWVGKLSVCCGASEVCPERLSSRKPPHCASQPQGPLAVHLA